MVGLLVINGGLYAQKIRCHHHRRGIVGSMVARFLSKFQLEILLIEKEVDVGMGASSANSAILHAGYDALPGSTKPMTNMMAVEMWPALSQELGIDYSRCGDYVVAVNEDEVSVLEDCSTAAKAATACRTLRSSAVKKCASVNP
jgi:L-2-hydroxyglutarate oxidase LhgO